MNTLPTINLILVGIVALLSGSAFETARLIVLGQFYCDGKPYPKVTVRLYDREMNEDSLMAKNLSLKDGSFYLDGKSNKSSIDPKLHILHTCTKGALRCQHKWAYGIPKEYVFDEKDNKLNKPVDIGRWELVIKPEDQVSSHCRV